MRKIITITGPGPRAFAVQQVINAPEGHVVQIAEMTRTLEQNSKLWPMLADIQRDVPDMRQYSTDDIKLRFMDALGSELRYLPKIEAGGFFPVGHKSSQLTKAQFAGLVELLYKFGAENGVRWSEPPQELAA